MKTIQVTLTDEQYEQLNRLGELYWDGEFPNITLLAYIFKDKKTLKLRCDEIMIDETLSDLYTDLFQKVVKESGYSSTVINKVVGSIEDHCPVHNMFKLKKLANSQNIKEKIDCYIQDYELECN